MKQRLRSWNLMGWVTVLLIVLSGCYPNGPEFIQDYNIVVTDYDPDFDFGSRKTYYMPDTINFETNITGEDIEERLREIEALILDVVEDNMADKNYDRIDTTSIADPDLVLTRPLQLKILVSVGSRVPDGAGGVVIILPDGAGVPDGAGAILVGILLDILTAREPL
jgi:hypothetical protein